MSTKYEEYGIPQSLIISGIKYSFIEYSTTSDIFKYRCANRACNCYIKIKKEEIDKLSILDTNANINYNIFNEHKNHKGTELTISKSEVKTDKEIESLAVSLIKNNIT